MNSPEGSSQSQRGARELQYVKLEFDTQIIRISNDGFSSLSNGYVIKFKDNKEKHNFKIGDILHIEIENTTEVENDHITNNHSVIYTKLNSYITNGITFKNFKNSGFFWDIRGMITHKYFEDNSPWEPNSILRITIKILN